MKGFRKQSYRLMLMGGIATGALPAAMPAPARAQALQPVVDVCSGITLPRSAITEVIGAVNQPIVQQLETTVNGLTTVTLILAPLVTLPDLDIDLSSILADAEEGEPISLQLLDTDGNVITASDDCNIAADGVALNEEAGLAIGGNQITGLGADGATASAGELDAIALGNNATTAAGAGGAIAIGTDASATAANSVALGAGSVADRGALPSYTAPGLAGTYASAGSVSVGAAGAERQITNVAPGTAATDAATVGQVQGALDAVDALADSAVQYDGAAQASVTLGGAGGTTIANLADGAIGAGSSEAVNGSQLFDTNTAVAANTADIAQNAADITDNGAAIAQNTADIAGNTADIATNTTEIANNAANIAENTADIAGNTADIAQNAADIGVLQDTSVQYDDTSQQTVTLGGAGGTVVTNVGDGTIGAGSSDAVNGSQLFDTNQQVAQNSAEIADLDGRVTQTEADIAGLDGRVTQTEADIADLDARVDNQQVVIDGFDDRIAANEGDIASLDGRVTANEGAIARNTADIADLDGRVTVNEGDIAALDGRVTVNEGDIERNTVDIANLDGRVTVNEGDIARNSSEIAGLDTRVTVNEGDIARNTTEIAGLDGRVTVNEGDIAAIDGRVTVNEGDIARNTTDIANLDGRTTVNEGDIADLDIRVTDNSSSITVLQEQLANVPVTYVDPADGATPSATPTDTVALIAADGGAATLTNVAAGTLAAGSTEAVNGAQLFATNEVIAANARRIASNTQNMQTIVNNIEGSTVVAVQYSDPDDPTRSNGGTLTNDVTLVGADAAAPVALHNVADGRLANDAVNLGQLQSGLEQVMSESAAYTDMRFAALDFDLEQVRDDAIAGTAGAMALAGLPQTVEAGRSMIAGAVGHYRGETAFALGFSSTVGDGRGVVTVGGTVDSRGYVGASAGAGFSF